MRNSVLAQTHEALKAVYTDSQVMNPSYLRPKKNVTNNEMYNRPVLVILSETLRRGVLLHPIPELAPKLSTLAFLWNRALLGPRNIQLSLCIASFWCCSGVQLWQGTPGSRRPQ
jgi:hypothetical protein